MKWIYIGIIGIFLIVCIILININRDDNNGKYSRELNKIINKKMKYDKLLTIHYNKSGDKIGSLKEIIIDIDNKTLKYQYRDAHYSPNNVEIYSITDDDINLLNNKIIEYNLPAWSKLKLSDIIVYDASSENIQLTYDNKKVGGDSLTFYNISFDYIIPSDGYQVLNEFRDDLFNLIRIDNLINSYQENIDNN